MSLSSASLPLLSLSLSALFPGLSPLNILKDRDTPVYELPFSREQYVKLTYELNTKIVYWKMLQVFSRIVYKSIIILLCYKESRPLYEGFIGGGIKYIRSRLVCVTKNLICIIVFYNQ